MATRIKRGRWHVGNAGGLIAMLLCFTAGACEVAPAEDAPTARIRGRTMGTSYSIIAVGASAAERAALLEASVDSILVVINAEVNTYDANSLISRLNAGDTLTLPANTSTSADQSTTGYHLARNLELALEPYRVSEGMFDPTVGPLVEYYGFGSGFSNSSAIDDEEVERLRAFVGFDKVIRDTMGATYRMYNQSSGVSLDLSSLAKGYAVDVISDFLQDEEEISSYFVEIGGETRTAGQSPRDSPWTVGINTPLEDATTNDLELILAVGDVAIATSGNYRNVRVRGGKKIAHTIDPKSGLPRMSTLLSATVIAPDCATADAYATACMASAELASEVLAKAQLAGCLIFADGPTRFRTEYIGNFEDYVLADELE